VIRYHDTKESRGKAADIRVGGWSSSPMKVPRVSAARLQALGWEEERAIEVTETCCLVRTLAEYMRRAAPILQRGNQIKIGGRQCLASSTILFLQAFKPGAPLRFLGPQRINKRLQAFHNAAGILPPCGQEASKEEGSVFYAKHWRHVSASCIAFTSSPEEAKHSLHHSAVSTFERHYKIGLSRDFVGRWLDLPASKRALSVVERLLV